MAVVHKPADRPAVATSLNRDLARIQEWCNHWWMILNPDKTKASVVSRSRTVDPPHWWLGLVWGLNLRDSPNLDILGLKFDSRLTVEDLARGIVSRVSQRIGIFRFVKRVLVDTHVLLRCIYAFVLPILKYCSPVVGLLLNVVFGFSRARCIRWPCFTLIRLYCRCVIHVICVCCTMLIRTWIIVYSVSLNLLLSEFDMSELLLQLIHKS